MVHSKAVFDLFHHVFALNKSKESRELSMVAGFLYAFIISEKPVCGLYEWISAHIPPEPMGVDFANNAVIYLKRG